MRGGVSMDMLLMDKVLEVYPDDMQVTLQTGIVKTALQVIICSGHVGGDCVTESLWQRIPPINWQRFQALSSNVIVRHAV